MKHIILSEKSGNTAELEQRMDKACEQGYKVQGSPFSYINDRGMWIGVLMVKEDD